MASKQIRICAMGAASQDVFISGSQISAVCDVKTKECVESFPLGAKIDVDKVVFDIGGGATNAAVTFSRQGLQASFIGKIGDDVAGHAVIRCLDEEDIMAEHVVIDKKFGTQYSTILLADTGERSILIYRGAANDHHIVDYEDVDYSKYDWLYLSSFGGSMKALSSVIKNAAKSGVNIAINPGKGELEASQELAELLPLVSLISVNKEEAEKLVDGSTIEDLALKLAQSVDMVLVSDGPNGSVATDGEMLYKAGMYDDVIVIDRTGSGDAFTSGFVSQIAQGEILKDALIFASANSTSVVTKIGSKKGILHKGAKIHDMKITEAEI
jgi:sugar/nucleoside kinase (ribokinase family)